MRTRRCDLFDKRIGGGNPPLRYQVELIGVDRIDISGNEDDEMNCCGRWYLSGLCVTRSERFMASDRLKQYR
jgi:hypothetical protein